MPARIAIHSASLHQPRDGATQESSILEAQSIGKASNDSRLKTPPTMSAIRNGNKDQRLCEDWQCALAASSLLPDESSESAGMATLAGILSTSEDFRGSSPAP